MKLLFWLIELRLVSRAWSDLEDTTSQKKKKSPKLTKENQTTVRQSNLSSLDCIACYSAHHCRVGRWKTRTTEGDLWHRYSLTLEVINVCLVEVERSPDEQTYIQSRLALWGIQPRSGADHTLWAECSREYVHCPGYRLIIQKPVNADQRRLKSS